MKIKQTAIAGTLESSDVQVMLSPGTNGIQIELQSDVVKQFGSQIKQLITDTLVSMDIESANVEVIDKGALDCVIKARTIAVVQRTTQTVADPNWEVY